MGCSLRQKTALSESLQFQHNSPGEKDKQKSAVFTTALNPFLWSGQRDSNPRMSAWEADALPLGDARICGKQYTPGARGGQGARRGHGAPAREIHSPAFAQAGSAYRGRSATST